MVEPKNVTYEEFPEAMDKVPGMKELNISREEQCLFLHANIPYIKRDGLELHLHIISPVKNDNINKLEKYPCIVYIQGSAWCKQDTFMNIPNLSKLAERGFVIASVEYRHTEIAPFPAQIQDAKTAIRFMRKNASRYNLDPENIFVFGDSSGGHTALMVGITEAVEELDTADYGEYSAKVGGIIDFYGPTDIAKMNDVPSVMNHIEPNSPEGMLIGGKNVIENMEEAKKTSPVSYILRERSIAPILIFHGSKDRLVPFQQSILLYDALKAADKKVDFYKINGADHGGGEFWSEDVLKIVEEFIRKNRNDRQ